MKFSHERRGRLQSLFQSPALPLHCAVVGVLAKQFSVLSARKVCMQVRNLCSTQQKLNFELKPSPSTWKYRQSISILHNNHHHHHLLFRKRRFLLVSNLQTPSRPHGGSRLAFFHAKPKILYIKTSAEELISNKNPANVLI